MGFLNCKFYVNYFLYYLLFIYCRRFFYFLFMQHHIEKDFKQFYMDCSNCKMYLFIIFLILLFIYFCAADDLYSCSIQYYFFRWTVLFNFMFFLVQATKKLNRFELDSPKIRFLSLFVWTGSQSGLKTFTPDNKTWTKSLKWKHEMIWLMWFILSETHFLSQCEKHTSLMGGA